MLHLKLRFFFHNKILEGLKYGLRLACDQIKSLVRQMRSEYDNYAIKYSTTEQVT